MMNMRRRPEVVGDPTTQEQQAAEGQGVGTHDPLPVGDRDVQGPLGRGQGHDHHRRVEHDHELGHGDDRQGPVPLGVGGFGLRCGVGTISVVVTGHLSADLRWVDGLA